MRFRVAVALVLMSASARAQVSPADVKAREIYAKVVAFRTSAGHNQTAPMVAYLTGVLTAGGVPQADITTLDVGEDRAMIVRLPSAPTASHTRIATSAD